MSSSRADVDHRSPSGPGADSAPPRGRRRLVLLIGAPTVAVVVAVVVALFAAGVFSTGRQPVASPSPNLAPGCPTQADAALRATPGSRQSVRVVHLQPGASAPVVANVTAGPRHYRVVWVELILGKPGSSPGVGPINRLPPSAGLRPSNQLAVSDRLTDLSTSDTLRWRIPALNPGRYPVFIYYSQVVPGAACVGGTDVGMGQIGTIAVGH